MSCEIHKDYDSYCKYCREWSYTKCEYNMKRLFYELFDAKPLLTNLFTYGEAAYYWTEGKQIVIPMEYYKK